MKRSSLAPLSGSLLLAVLMHLPTAAKACSVCMGDPNSKYGMAINGAIFLMLGFIGFVLSAVGVFAWNLARRARLPSPPHAEFIDLHHAHEDVS